VNGVLQRLGPDEGPLAGEFAGAFSLLVGLAVLRVAHGFAAPVVDDGPGLLDWRPVVALIYAAVGLAVPGAVYAV
jgi:hypothetical protein